MMKRALLASTLLMLAACEAAPYSDPPLSPVGSSGFVEVFPHPKNVKYAGEARIRLVVGDEVEADGVFELPYSQLFYGDPRAVKLDATSTESARWLSCSIYSGKVNGEVLDEPAYTHTSKTTVHCGE